MHTQYFARDLIGLMPEQREVLAKIYLNRKKSFTDPIWIDIYAEWLRCTDETLQGEGYDLPKLKAKAAYYYEKIANKGDKWMDVQ